MISLSDIHVAHKTIANIAKKTPILTSTQLSELCQNQIYLKAEHLQKTGSFKIRGAYNCVKHAVNQGATLVTAASSGNHGQAVAYAAHLLGIKAIIVIPEDAAQCKINAIKAYHGQIEKCGTTSGERIPRALELAKLHHGTFIPPYDDPFVMAGQGTIGLELLEQIPTLDAVIVPVGGGGLISGILTAIKEQKPTIQVIGVEPAEGNDTYLSLQQGQQITIPATHTIADGLRTSRPGNLTFPIVQKYLDDLILIEENEIKMAFSFVLERMKQLIEPSSATTIAALMQHKIDLQNKQVACIISGGNVDLETISTLL